MSKNGHGYGFFVISHYTLKIISDIILIRRKMIIRVTYKVKEKEWS